MQKSSATPRWWDWYAIALLFLLVETVASRLVTTGWTEFLFLSQTVAYIGFTVGMILGYTRFSPRVAHWISFLYMLVMIPLQWTLVIDQSASLEEQFLSVAGRLFYSFSDFFAGRTVEDPFLFISLVTLGFWFIGASAAFQLVRYQRYLAAVLPSAIALLIIQTYDNFLESRILILGFFAFLALLLLGRMNFLENKQSWRERHVFLSPDNSVDLTSTMAITAALLIIIAWTPPASLSGFDSAIRTWNKITQPWRTLTEKLENAVSPLESPSGGKRGEFFGSEIALGRGFPLTDTVMFSVEVPDLPTDERPPRYYWRGRTYDYYVDGQWFTTGTSTVDYSPEENLLFSVPNMENAQPERFKFNTGDETFSLIYAPQQPVWVSRQGVTFKQSAGSNVEINSWFAYPALQSGETYQVDSFVSNPNTRQLSEAGTNYPDWVTVKFLQLPSEFSPEIIALAREITADSETPFDKTLAITSYLRSNIEYAETIPAPPRNQEALDWILFDYKKGYCVYYASAEVLMLRSIGVPARLAVGFAQGERDGNDYVVHRYDAHAWPEVYFPDVGWVEFEPTGNQPALSRPLPPRNEDTAGPAQNLNREDSINNRDLPGLQEGETDIAVPDQVDVTPAVNPSLYLTPLLIILALLTIYFGRRYSVPARIPVLLRTTYERSGIQTPAWILHWERWIDISPIERSFESINFGLRLLDRSLPVYATPVERAKGLTRLLPKVENEIQALLDEHQTSLYTSRQADARRARHAAFNIRLQAIIERIRYILEGKPIESP